MQIDNLNEAELKAIQFGLQSVIELIEDGLAKNADTLNGDAIESSNQILFAAKGALKKSIDCNNGMFCLLHKIKPGEEKKWKK